MTAIEDLKIKETSQHERELTITVGSTVVGKEFANALNSVQRVASRPGFRPGKMPKNVVMTFFSGEIKQKLLQKLVEKSFDDACKEHALVPVSKPMLEPMGEIVEDKPFTYRAIFQVKPKVTVANYQGLAIELKKFTFSEADVDDEIKSLQENMATFIEPTEREIIGPQDLVQCDSEIMIDGALAPDYSHKDYAVPLFAENVPADLRTELLGKKIGDTAKVTYTMPADHQDEAISGKQCEMHLTIRSFKERVLPAINDDLAKDISEKFESLDSLKESIRLRYSITAKRRDEYFRQDAITKALVAQNPFEVPPALIEKMALMLINRELEAMDQKIADNLIRNHWQEMWQSVQQRAEFRVKVELILEALVDSLAIEVSDEEIRKKTESARDTSKDDARYAIQVEKLMGAIEKNAVVSTVDEPLFNKG